MIDNVSALIREVPKAELHVHIEGTLEPDLVWKKTQRSGLAPQRQPDFHDLQEFLDLYYDNMSCLKTAADFYDLAIAYFRRCQENRIVHTEFFFDPQAHTQRGVAFATIIEGLTQAREVALRTWGITSAMILCFLRDCPVEDAEQVLSAALPYKKHIIGVGLDSAELGFPPERFRSVFQKARAVGFRLCAHAGEEGPAEYVKNAIEQLNVDRIDHGIRSIDDEVLLNELVKKQIPLTVCPLANQKLQVTPDLSQHPLCQLLERGVLVSIHSDDPAYFGGYLCENYLKIQQHCGLTPEQLHKLVENSFRSSFLPQKDIDKHCRSLARCVETYR